MLKKIEYFRAGAFGDRLSANTKLIIPVSSDIVLWDPVSANTELIIQVITDIVFWTRLSANT